MKVVSFTDLVEGLEIIDDKLESVVVKTIKKAMEEKMDVEICYGVGRIWICPGKQLRDKERIEYWNNVFEKTLGKPISLTDKVWNHGVGYKIWIGDCDYEGVEPQPPFPKPITYVEVDEVVANLLKHYFDEVKEVFKCNMRKSSRQ